MRRMRIKNDPENLGEKFLWCKQQRNKPRVHYSVCENCPLKNSCGDYKNFYLRKIKRESSEETS